MTLPSRRQAGIGRLIVAGLAGVLTIAPVSEAIAQDKAAPPAITWQWRRHHPADYAATGVFAAASLATELVPHSDEPRLKGANGFDDAFRDAFGLYNHSGRAAAARISDITLAALVAHRLIVDDALVAWAGHGAGDAAWQMAAIDMQAILFTFAFTGAAKRGFERERPSSRACRTDAQYDRRCEDQGRDGSFFSGHTSLAFTASSLTCMHHLNLPLYGGQGDVIACVAAQLAASSVAFERVLADRHYASDVFTGAAVGVLSGALLPWLSFYGRPDGRHAGATYSLSPAATPTGGGVSMQGLF